MYNIEFGKYGVIIEKKGKSGIFLPQVADDFNLDLESFLGELCEQKTDLSRDCYKNDPDVKIKVFTAQFFEE